jgi:heterodisulfide reductase subunit B
MKVSFFPGCSLEGTAREYGESIEDVCSSLGIELEELKDWTCCGASSAHCTNEFLSIALPARNLACAEKLKQDLVTPCAACFSRLKTAAEALTGSEKQAVEIPFNGDISVLHILEFLLKDEFAEKIMKKIKKPLKGLKTVSYYGCLLARPPQITKEKHWEDPGGLDALISILDGENISWPYKTECCGGSLVLTNLEIEHKLVGRILDMALEAEADCIVTACPLCMSNIDTREEEIGALRGISYDLPIFYFTELMGLAFGSNDTDSWFKRHIIDPRPLLQSKGLM